MTQRTINLYDGLEALYYFDSDYFDGTTGEIKDKSGHGRHAKANGGPTVGVNGPNDFEAANFSGGNSGDFFLLPQFTVNDGEPWSLFSLIKVDDNSRNTIIARKESSSELIYIQAKALRFLNNDFNTYVNNQSTFNFGKWTGVAVTTDGTNMRLYADNTSPEVVTPSDTSMSFGNIGHSENNSQYMNGDIAVSGVWTRQITQSEIEKLFDTTAPRRAQL